MKKFVLRIELDHAGCFNPQRGGTQLSPFRQTSGSEENMNDEDGIVLECSGCQVQVVLTAEPDEDRI